ncbi:uncharacterized protein LOC128387625 [Panonychus citri]|uniref:uncharacterized protein LOC128387625 n=1 Tax=Panonychus citri TaxID=50023 RepID=UPI002307EC6C|nr:uncharacterized protein LOC128387625 [Panonychus citri]
MDKSLLLSGEQLLELKCLYQEEKKMRRKRQRFNSSNLSIKREEIPSPGVMVTIEQEVNRQLEDRFELLGRDRVRSSNEMGLAEWIPESKSSKVISTKKRSPWMGFMENNQLMYSPEETIFLMECESILVNYMGAQLSLQSAYQLILSNNQLGRNYQIYSYLTRLGFKLKSFKCDDKKSLTKDQSNSSLDVKTITDHLNEKINRLTYKPSCRSNFNNLQVVVTPLRRPMFLNGTSFAKTANWSEYKRLMEPRENSSIIFDEESTVLELNDDLRSKENILDQLPNSSLIDHNNGLKPLIDQTKIIDINKLHEIIKIAGPQEQNLHQLLPSSKCKLEINYQVFMGNVKNFNSTKPDNCLIITNEQFTPMIQELISLDENCNESTPIFAVNSHSEFNFNTLQHFHLWEEIPTFWDSSLNY